MTLRGIGHRFGDAPPLFSGLDAHMDAGRTYAVVGPSGSGKSTLLALVAGSLTPSEGVIERVDVEAVRWVFQNPHGVARRAALDHVSLPLLARGLTRDEADAEASGLLDEVGLGHVADRRFGMLSGGEAQRLMLARGIASAPDLLLVDEPTAQLDRRTAAEVNDVLGALSGRGAIVVVATHDPATRGSCDAVIDLAGSER